MSRLEDFEVGRTYFTVFYMDERLLNPVVETIVYLGPDTMDDGESVHTFQYAVSFHRDGNWNDLPEEARYDFAEPPTISFPLEHHDNVVDLDGLVAELEEWRARS